MICTKCKIDKADSEFSKRNTTRLNSWCKSCHKEYRKKYNLTNKEKISSQNKQYRIVNRDKNFLSQQKRSKVYSKTLKGRYNAYRNNARRRKIEFSLSLEAFQMYWQEPCNYCGLSIDTIGLDRIDNSQGYNLSNIVSCCELCNKMKLTLTQQEFFDHIKKLYSQIISREH